MRRNRGLATHRLVMLVVSSGVLLWFIAAPPNLRVAAETSLIPANPSERTPAKSTSHHQKAVVPLLSPERAKAEGPNNPAKDQLHEGVRTPIHNPQTLWQIRYAKLSAEELSKVRISLGKQLNKKIEREGSLRFQNPKNVLPPGQFPDSRKKGMILYAQRLNHSESRIEFTILPEANYPQLYALKREYRWLRKQEEFGWITCGPNSPQFR